MSAAEQLFAIAGRPVLHSKSPLLFNSCFRADDEPAIYTRISAQSASEVISMVRGIGLSGLNLTAPLKQRILPVLDEVDRDAAIIGAVNTVINERGQLKGFNTDHLGVTAALAGRGVGVRGRRCLVLGAGGAGRAAAFGLVQAGAQVVIANRSPGRAAQAAAALGCQDHPLQQLGPLLERSEIVVSALAPGINPISKDWLRPSHVVLDANYPRSPLLELARSRGCTMVSGEDWLLNQAVPAYQLFTGRAISRERMERAGASGGEPATARDVVSIIGFMGCGKTTIGRALAARLGYSFKDTDAAIEERAGMSVAEIFRRQGERAFRSLERTALAGIEQDRATVYACGGGALQDPANRRALKQRSVVIWLYAPLEPSLLRIDPRTRPLLSAGAQGAGPQALFRSRVPDYARTADLIVANDGAPDETVEHLYEDLRHILDH